MESDRLIEIGQQGQEESKEKKSRKAATRFKSLRPPTLE